MTCVWCVCTNCVTVPCFSGLSTGHTVVCEKQNDGKRGRERIKGERKREREREKEREREGKGEARDKARKNC